MFRIMDSRILAQDNQLDFAFAPKQQVEPSAEKLSALCLERYGNVLAPYILSEEELDKRTGLPLIDSIRKGIVLYPPLSAHES